MGDVFMSGKAKMCPKYIQDKVVPEFMIEDVKPSLKERIIKITLWIYGKLFGK